jgi:hypothetical protein
MPGPPESERKIQGFAAHRKVLPVLIGQGPFDYLVGAGMERCRHFEGDCPSGFEIDGQLEPGCCSTGRSAGLAPLKMRAG